MTRHPGSASKAPTATKACSSSTLSQDLDTASFLGKRIKDLHALSDAELVQRIRAGEDKSVRVMLNRYRRLVAFKAHAFDLPGSTRADVLQEANIGLFKAIRDFDQNNGTPFGGFAEMCITRHLCTALKTAARRKHDPLNLSRSLDTMYNEKDESTMSAHDSLAIAECHLPDEMAISAMEIEDLRHFLIHTLTTMEREAIRLFVEGRSYDEIATSLGSHIKGVDNAIQRVRRKLKAHLSNHDSLDAFR